MLKVWYNNLVREEMIVSKRNWERDAELRNEFGKGTKMVRLMFDKSGKVKTIKFKVK